MSLSKDLKNYKSSISSGSRCYKEIYSIPVTREAISSMFEVLLKTFDTVVDDRWDRSMIEWIREIIQTAP